MHCRHMTIHASNTLTDMMQTVIANGRMASNRPKSKTIQRRVIPIRESGNSATSHRLSDQSESTPYHQLRTGPDPCLQVTAGSIRVNLSAARADLVSLGASRTTDSLVVKCVDFIECELAFVFSAEGSDIQTIVPKSGIRRLDRGSVIGSSIEYTGLAMVNDEHMFAASCDQLMGESPKFRTLVSSLETTET